MKKYLFLGLFIGSALIGFSEPTLSIPELKELLKKHLDIITESVKENPEVFIDALQFAGKKYQQRIAERAKEEAEKVFAERLENPLKPLIREDELIRGSKDGPIVLVEYSDFQCLYCSTAATRVHELLEEYKGEIQFVYKHAPLRFHEFALISAIYYEAIKVQGGQLAFQFHDALYENQDTLSSEGEVYLKRAAEYLGVDMIQLAEDIQKESIRTKIDEDKAEAKESGLQGTPSFVLNGIPIKGAKSKKYFVDMIEALEKKRGHTTLVKGPFIGYPLVHVCRLPEGKITWNLHYLKMNIGNNV
ncbi:MAG: thioredoxin domain-containing protein [Kiritimatiellae bacterium]|nr:thioredoxin domain-containing protein [Kiritimatiellia bacterium]